ncbi:uncharacterized protein LOC134247980 [Saccostrea cucullata]|uniref:uncharacterized protein LOC134247980 n=1 Tax=Saccostrea cuccullata TaxID=36930 RepID=UPI002ED3CA97
MRFSNFSITGLLITIAVMLFANVHILEAVFLPKQQRNVSSTKVLETLGEIFRGQENYYHQKLQLVQNVEELIYDVQTLKNEVARLKEENVNIQTNFGNSSEALAKNEGALYTRWGRSECPENETELVYQGFVGGSYYLHQGGSVNYICLPYDPTWGKYNDVLNNDNQNLHGVEYAGNSINISGTPFDGQLRGHGVPCAVCRSTKRRSVLRIPGRNKCYNGWHLEYAGYLMADKFTHASATEYACVDEFPEKSRTGPVSKGGKYFYPVEAHCGYSLQCPPYVHGREITCAICTK